MYKFFPVMPAAAESFWEKLAAWYQNSLLKEILTYLEERYFTVEFGNYNNFAMTDASALTARNAILALAAGVIIAAVMTAYLRMGLGGFVRRLIKSGATSPETAQTLSELGYFRSTMIRRELSRGSSLRMVVRRLGEGQGSEPSEETTENRAEKSTECAPEGANNAHTSFKKREKLDFTAARFYIPEELVARAEIRFDQKGSGWLPVILTSVGALVVAAALCFFLPDLFQFADNLMNMF